jgi:xanthine dehydrogenase YagT iron-sulfur-binding subunit
MSEDKARPRNDRPDDNHTGDGNAILSPSRRGFLLQLGTAGIVVTASAPESGSEAAADTGAKLEPAGGGVPVALHVNGRSYSLSLDPRATLLDCLREVVHLTGTKKGCDHGQCGACTVHVNGRRINSCLSLAVMHQGDEITTIEGLGQPGNLDPMQAAFLASDGYQCGYCTSGQIMSATALLKEPCGPGDADVKEAMSGNICRCGAYANILEAIQSVRKRA